MECFSLREGASKPIPAFFSILIVLLSPVIFCKALAFPLQQLANRYKATVVFRVVPRKGAKARA
jgi:hypothetical protein